MAVEPLLLDDERAVAPGHAGEHAFRDGTAGDGELRVRVCAQQVVEHAGGQDRVAEPIGGDEQDSHRGADVACPVDAGLPRHPGHPTSEGMLTLLPDRAVLAVAGEERVAFLQGLVSNDVAEATADRAIWAALLTPQGKWLADFFIIATPDRLLLDVEAAQAAMLIQRLTRFRLRAKVSVEAVDAAVHAGWNVPPPPGATPDPRHASAGWRLIGGAAGASTASPAEYDLHRLRLGLPDGSRDMEAEKTTLLEAGFDELNGVSWTKGCYMGQELTARTKYRGLLKRRFVPVLVDGPLPLPGTPVLSGEAEVGTMRSGRADRGLALLRIEAIGTSALLCGEARVTPEPPLWMALTPVRLAGAPA